MKIWMRSVQSRRSRKWTLSPTSAHAAIITSKQGNVGVQVVPRSRQDESLETCRGRPELVFARDDVGGEIGADLAPRLLDRPGGQPEIDRAAILVAQPVALAGLAVAAALDVVEGPAEDDRQLVGVGFLGGKYTDTPVRTRFGFHIIQLDDVRPAKFASLAEVRPRIQQMLVQNKIEQLVKGLRAKAKVEQ